MGIKIQPVRFADNGFMTRPFALGISPEQSGHCGAMSLARLSTFAINSLDFPWNWVQGLHYIAVSFATARPDIFGGGWAGSEVILVDTGFPAEYPDMADGSFCLIHGDVTCTDVALYENRLFDLGKTLCEGAILFSQAKLEDLQGALSDE